MPLKTGDLLKNAKKKHKELSLSYLRLLLSHRCGRSPEYLWTHPELRLEEEVISLFFKDVEKLAAGMPLSRILGYREFWGNKFYLNEATLDPRPDSETLIDCVLNCFPSREMPLHILDLGTGTGCLLITLLKEYSFATGVAVDISTKALSMAAHNASSHGVAERMQFLESNWFEKVTGKFSLIISNPPYISQEEFQNLEENVKSYDPSKALKGGEDGLEAYKCLIPLAKSFLEEKGALTLEIGRTQRKAVEALFERERYDNVKTFQDLASLDRCVMGFKQ